MSVFVSQRGLGSNRPHGTTAGSTWLVQWDQYWSSCEEVMNYQVTHNEDM